MDSRSARPRSLVPQGAAAPAGFIVISFTVLRGPTPSDGLLLKVTTARPGRILHGPAKTP